MRKKLIPEKEIITLSKDVVQSFYDRNIKNHIHYLSDDFMWIGAFDFQYTLCKNDFLCIIQSEISSFPFTMIDEEFTLISKSPTTYIISARFKLIAHTDNNTTIRTHTRMTVIWKYYGEELKLCHVHGSNAQDIPLSINNAVMNTALNDDFSSYINSLHFIDNSNKIAFRTKSGAFRYFTEREILYLEANSQSTFLHTYSECIELYSHLLTNAERLSQSFYRIHKSYIVNTAFIKSLERYKVILTTSAHLPISKEKYIAFRDFLQNQKH